MALYFARSMIMLTADFFDQDACYLAQQLLGKVIRKKYQDTWLQAQIIETEAYYLDDKASHASLGFTEKRKALFMPPGTIYMYYARGGDSLNISCQGEGNAVLIKSAYPYPVCDDKMISLMQQLNPQKNKPEPRAVHRLCHGQTLLCRSLQIKVPDWDQKNFCHKQFFIADMGITPAAIIQTTRLGIPKGRDETLNYRFIDSAFNRYCTKPAR